MASRIRQILKKLSEITARKINTEDKIISSAQREFIETMNEVDKKIAMLLSKMKQTGGVIAKDERQLAALVNQKVELQKIMVESGYFEVAERFVDGYDKMFSFLKEQFAVIGTPLVFTEIDIAAITQLKRLDLQTFAKLADDTVNALSDQIYKSVLVSTPVNRITEIVKETLDDTMTKHAKTITNTSISEFDRTVNALKSESAEIEKFVYMGPLDDVTREFCRELLEKQDAGKGYFTADEIARMDNGQGLDVMTSGGGWNCRHRWVGVPDAVLSEVA